MVSIRTKQRAKKVWLPLLAALAVGLIAAALMRYETWRPVAGKPDPLAYLQDAKRTPAKVAENPVTQESLPDDVPPPEPKPIISLASAELAEAAAPAAPKSKREKVKQTGKKREARNAAPAKANGATKEVWDRWNVAPYASTLPQACEKLLEALDGFAMPLTVKEHFKRELGSSCAGGAEVWLTPHQRLEAMWSGGNKPHVLRNVIVGELPVLKSPDGRPYRTGAVAETAKALSWTYVYEGETYVLYLPFVCFNWSWAFGSPLLTTVAETCATVNYAVAPGDLVRFAVIAKARLPSSSCWQLCDGPECSAPPSPCDDCSWIGPLSVLPQDVVPQHTGMYRAKHAPQTLRFPLQVRTVYVALCDDRPGVGESDSWIVQPSAWGDGTAVVVPYGGQPWPAWGQVDMSKWR